MVVLPPSATTANYARNAMTNTTYHVCGKCGKLALNTDDWLIAQRVGQPEGYLIIRCPEHVTDHARRIAGLTQQWFHENRSKK